MPKAWESKSPTFSLQDDKYLEIYAQLNIKWERIQLIYLIELKKFMISSLLLHTNLFDHMHTKIIVVVKWETGRMLILIR